MLSYRHSFHAGNHADVVKHLVQTLILDALKQKEKPFVYHDTHSGAGRYDLTHEWAEKTGEYKEGIGRIWQADAPQELASYFATISAVNNGATAGQPIRYYPGSPRVARTMIRDQDRMQLTELHPADFALLKQEFQRDRQVRIEQHEGLETLIASMPPKERRGMVMIDPPYELKSEYKDVTDAVIKAHRRWATGIFTIWYPVVQRSTIDRMCKALEQSGIRKILQIELGIAADSDERGMTASGLIVINPPWKLESQMQTVLPWLQAQIAPADGHHLVQWIIPE